MTANQTGQDALSRREKARIWRAMVRKHFGKFIRAVAVGIGISAVLTAVLSFAGLGDSGWSGAVYSAIAVLPGVAAVVWFDAHYAEPERRRVAQTRTGV